MLNPPLTGTGDTCDSIRTAQSLQYHLQEIPHRLLDGLMKVAKISLLAAFVLSAINSNSQQKVLLVRLIMRLSSIAQT